MFMTSTSSIDISILISQAEVLERAEGIRKENNELDTVWFMAGSLFQLFAPQVYLDNCSSVSADRISSHG
ncbi:hypothetical protein L6452_12359 [Arctium lappa]|uniref:Uncharacterized protein n=1 Tax=Arctium lappa TaxID=4217 RepID=A0ACB9DRI1_ARCLA|nr:hypothetical protein L6452_12359 [Arctium lappa]